jgi:hypothetical protein
MPTTAHHLRLPALLLLSMFAVAACGGDDDTGDPYAPRRVETSTSSVAVTAGERVEVACTFFTRDDAPVVGLPFDIRVTPAEGVSRDGATVTFTKTGVFAVACASADGALVDNTPTSVTVSHGVAARTTLVIDPASFAAGESTAATCLAFDAFGNQAGANLRLESEPATGLTFGEVDMVSGAATIAGRQTGAWEVTCFAINVTDLGRAAVTVTPGPRKGIRLKALPEALAYAVGQPVRIEAEGVDAWGNGLGTVVPIAGLDATPAGAHSVSGDAADRIRFNREGRFTTSAHAADAPDQTATLDLAVDETAPVITLELPARGVVTDSLQTLRFKGTVTDNLGEIERFRIAGTDVPVADGSGAFDVSLPLAYGLNLFDMVAADPYGHEALATRAAERSSDFYALSGRTLATDAIESAMAVVLTQQAIDDGVQNDGKRDDLASIVKYVLENINFAEFITNPIVQFPCIGGTCHVDLTAVTFESVTVNMPLKDGRIGIEAILGGFGGTLQLAFPCSTPILCSSNPMLLPGTLGIERILVRADIALAIVNGEVQASAENTDVELENITVDLQIPLGLGALTSGLLNALLDAIEAPIILVVEQVMMAVIQDQVANAFGSLFSALNLDLDFDLPAIVPGREPNTISLETRPQDISINPERIQLRMDALAAAQNPSRPHPHLGSIGHTGCAPARALTFPPPAPITVGLHDDLINQLLFAVWEGGTLNVALTPPASDALLGSFGFNGATLTVDALLPPVFNTCQPVLDSGTRDPAIVDRAQLGEIYAEIKLPWDGAEARIALWIMAEAPLQVTFEENAEGVRVARLVLDEITPLFVEVVANEGPFEGDDAAIQGLVSDLLIPQILTTVQDSAAFALPSIDLGALTTAVPPGTTINLNVQNTGRDNAYLTIFGKLE